MGSSITVKNNVAYITGVNKLRGMKLVGSDLRSSAALIIAALISNEISFIYGLEHLDRGYESIEMKLSMLGAQVTREIDIKKTKKSMNESSNLNKKDVSIASAA